MGCARRAFGAMFDEQPCLASLNVNFLSSTLHERADRLSGSLSSLVALERIVNSRPCYELIIEGEDVPRKDDNYFTRVY